MKKGNGLKTVKTANIVTPMITKSVKIPMNVLNFIWATGVMSGVKLNMKLKNND